MEPETGVLSERNVNLIGILAILVIALMLAVGVMFNPGAQSATVTPSYSDEFRTQARATIDAIERLERFSGALPEFEAQKALDRLDELATTAGEQNAAAIISTYRHRVEMVNIKAAEPHLQELSKARRDVLSLDLQK